MENSSTTIDMSLAIHTTDDTLVFSFTSLPVDPITDQVVALFRRVSVVLWVVICSAGILANLVNLHTFIKMRLGDSVTICLFALAVTDFFNCLLGFCQSLSVACELLEADWTLWFQLRPKVFTFITEGVRRIFSSTTVLITTFLSVQRCLCVMIPLHVRGLFTRAKTYFYLGFCAVFCTVPYCLITSTHGVIEVFSELFNSSQLTHYVRVDSSLYAVSSFIINSVLGVLLNMACQVVVVLCLILMALALKRSIRFKQSATTTASSSRVGMKEAGRNDGGDHNNDDIANAKEMQALRQVTLIASIFVCTNTPFFCFSVTKLFLPTFKFYGAHYNSFLFLYNLMFLSEMINSSVNFLIYFNYNSRYRKLCFIRL